MQHQGSRVARPGGRVRGGRLHVHGLDRFQAHTRVEPPGERIIQPESLEAVVRLIFRATEKMDARIGILHQSRDQS